MPMTAEISRSDALTAIPSSRTRQASFTTGKKIISMMSFSGNFTSCPGSDPQNQIQWNLQ